MVLYIQIIRLLHLQAPAKDFKILKFSLTVAASTLTFKQEEVEKEEVK